jgi:hypothetical protein
MLLARVLELALQIDHHRRRLVGELPSAIDRRAVAGHCLPRLGKPSCGFGERLVAVACGSGR